MSTQQRNLLVSVMIGVLVSGQTTGAFAGGFDNSGVGIKGISMGGALVGIADDASAVYWNPAGLAMKDQNIWDAELYGYGIFTDHKYTANSIKDRSEEIFIIPGVFVSRKQNDWGFGLGYYIPYGGGGTKYESFQGTPYDFEYKAGLAALTPTIAYRLHPDLSIGAGASVYMGAMESKIFNPNISTVVKSEYDDYIAGYSGNIGLMYKLTEKVRIGTSVKSRVPVKMDGTVTIAGNETDSEVDFTLPYYFSAGIGWKPSAKLMLGLSVCHMLWGDMDKITFTTAGIETEADTSYRDSSTVGLGLEYSINDDIALRAGLKYLQGATKEEGLNPAANDVDLLGGSIGVAYSMTEFMELNITGGYTFGFEEEYNAQTFDQDPVVLLVGLRMTK